jgi:hypothetical protein
LHPDVSAGSFIDRSGGLDGGNFETAEDGPDRLCRGEADSEQNQADKPREQREHSALLFLTTYHFEPTDRQIWQDHSSLTVGIFRSYARIGPFGALNS